MKFIYVAINAKYIHTSPAVRILNKIVTTKYESNFVEFSIKDNMDHIIDYLKDYDCINFSSYIWNIEYIIKIALKIRELYPKKTLVAGGPEVSYEPENFIKYFDYIMCGEGEEMVLPLNDYIVGISGTLPLGVASKLNPHAPYQIVKDLKSVPDILDSYSLDDMKNRIIYVETTRGCPFNCTYCLSSVEKGVRFFSDEYITHLFDFITNNEFKCIKFLDRTFNVNPNRFLKICRLLEKTNNTYQFEIAAELFNDDVIKYFTEEVTINKFRLEIGIQSLNDDAIKAVNRIQDTKRLLEVIEKINNANRCTIHTDLIAGLPYENFESFKKTFNKTFLLLTEELQLGFLKMLRGTEIRNDSQKYDYKFKSDAPYEVISNKFISEEELSIIHKCENSLEWMWNDKRAINLIRHLIKDNIIDSFFDFFVSFDNYYKKNVPLHENYINLVNYLKDIGIYKIEYLYDLKLDFLSKSRVKPMPFWKDKTKDDYLKKEFEFQSLGLDESYRNSFITKYYDKFIVIKYVKGLDPELKIMDPKKDMWTNTF